MKAVADELVELIRELQSLPSLNASVLGGGTNLAIRYGHRQSLDIDLFFPSIIGKAGFEKIKEEVTALFGENARYFDYPCDLDDQYLFQRFYVRKGDRDIKVEILQNMQNHAGADMLQEIRLMPETDIGPLKLLSASNRANQKDIYDLDYLTEVIPLPELMALLQERQMKYNQEEHKTIFDQDNEVSPVDDAGLLLKFEEPAKGRDSRPGHSNPRIEVMEGHKNWASARASWRRKVRAYYGTIGKEFPAPGAQ